jgi:hypothetical protein
MCWSGNLSEWQFHAQICYSVITLHGLPSVASLLRPTNVRRVARLLINAATIACQTTAGAPRGEADVVGELLDLLESKASLLSVLGTPSMPTAQPLELTVLPQTLFIRDCHTLGHIT